MVTINFYSYKGGVGRTMLTAQIARLLSAMGKKVVVADFDFDAPGIPAVFGKRVRDVGKGLFDIIFNFAYNESTVREKWVSTEEYQQELKKQLDAHFIHTKDITDNKDINDIYLLPSGKINDEYWETLSHAKWAEFLTDGIDRKEELSFKYFLEKSVKPALKSLGVDYLLIDSRAGITSYGKVGQQVSDVQAMIFCPNDEAKHMIEAGFFDKFKPQNPVFIISRIPPELDKPTQEAFISMKELLKGKFKYEGEILKFHSDLQAHLNPTIRNIDTRFSKTEQAKENSADMVQMHEDILMIFATLCPELLPNDSDNGELLKRVYVSWNKIFGYDFKMTFKNRLFDFLVNSGAMKNPDDETRNVAFKVETFLRLLSNLYLSLNLDYGDEGRNLFISALEKSGLKCGKDFGKEIREQWESENPVVWEKTAWVEKIKRWCKFDSDAGFGVLSYESRDKILTISNPFILDSTTIGGLEDNVAFLSGYSEGVLINLLSSNRIKVKHEKTVSGKKYGNVIEYKIEGIPS